MDRCWPAPQKGYLPFAWLVGCLAKRKRSHSRCASISDYSLWFAHSLLLPRCRLPDFDHSSGPMLDQCGRCWLRPAARLDYRSRSQPRSWVPDLHLQRPCCLSKRWSVQRCPKRPALAAKDLAAKELEAKRCFAAGLPSGWLCRPRCWWRRAEPRTANHRNLAPEVSVVAAGKKRWRKWC
jgi:hypothetical protein